MRLWNRAHDRFYHDWYKWQKRIQKPEQIRAWWVSGWRVGLEDLRSNLFDIRDDWFSDHGWD